MQELNQLLILTGPTDMGARLCSVTLKGLKRKQSQVISRYYLGISLEEMRKKLNTPWIG
jgi:hypothetical protein